MTEVLYLASQSPRRREILTQLGLPHRVLALRASPGREDVEETPYPEEPASAFALRMAREKAAAGWRAVTGRRLPPLPVLGADTVVECDGAIFGKPADREAARAMLVRLAAAPHRVHTGLAVVLADRLETCLSTSTVWFEGFDAAAIERYLDAGEYAGKAGAYAIQGRAAAFVARIEGSHTGIMGLPGYDTARVLRAFGIAV